MHFMAKYQTQTLIVKFQITITKIQTNYKFQYSMIKTVLIRSLFGILSMFGISNFGHCDLFDIYYL